MQDDLKHYVDMYECLKEDSLCLDIEMAEFNGAISVVGLFKPQDGLAQSNQFIRGRNLTSEQLRNALKHCKMLITFNGLRHDVPKIQAEFPMALPPNVKHFDVYLFAKKLNLREGLKLIEQRLGVERFGDVKGVKGMAIKLWKRYERQGDEQALRSLLDYNNQDTVNLYPLAEELVNYAKGNLRFL
jgi:uncharacterized protein YprB with RNaseH-like and TPR domain